VKLAVVYYSSTGTLHAMAQRIAQAGEKAGAEVRLRQVAEPAPAERAVSLAGRLTAGPAGIGSG
jgi:NAD(P)H dehydrogenase (quinone)